MPDKDSKTDPFKPQQPRIPGVSYDGPAEKEAENAPLAAPPITRAEFQAQHHSRCRVGSSFPMSGNPTSQGCAIVSELPN